MQRSSLLRYSTHVNDSHTNPSSLLHVTRLLENRPYIAERRYKGDAAASDILLDLEWAMSVASLTPRQNEAVCYVYDCGFTQTNTASRMNISQQAVKQLLQSACKKIAAVYIYWESQEEVVLSL